MSGDGDASADLFSEALVRSYVDEDPRFVERPWLADLIQEKLADPGCRFLLLTGEPGSGKTALMAWLARQHRDWPRYFIRRDSQVPLNSGDARSLLFALGHQLAALRPRVFHPDRLEVVVRQHLGEVAPGGRAVGIKVEDLEVSPFYATALRVEQEAGLVAGELAGISAARLVAEERFLELANLQYLALLEPAALLLREEPDIRLVLVVDALDELRYQAGRESALDWLAACPELPANVRFLLTSRPDEPLLELFRRRQGEWLREAAIDADSDELTQDLTRYATSFATEPKVAALLDEEQIAHEDFVGAAVTHAEGNFQYLAALFRGIEHTLAALAHAETGQESEWRAELGRLLRLEEVPAGLGELYSFFLSLIRDDVAAEGVEVPGARPGERERLPAWEGLYQPVLGVLAVAYEPLTAVQIAPFGAIKAEERWLRGALARLTQFLDHKDGRYRLYHASFPEYLTAAETRESHPDDYLDPTEWHRTIVGSYRRSTTDWNEVPWEEVDDYGLLHVAGHLAALASDGERRSEYSAELDALLCRPLMSAKRARFGSHQPFDHDVRASIAVALGDHDPAALVREVRGRYLHALLGALAGAVPLDALYALARAGESTRAVMLADLLPPEIRAAGYLLIAAGIAGAGHRSEAELLAEQALAMLPEPPSASLPLPERLGAALHEGASEPTLAGALELARRALAGPDDQAVVEPCAPMEGEAERGVAERARELLDLLSPDAANAVTARAVSASNATAEALVDAVESAVPAMAARGGYQWFPRVAEWFQALARLLTLVGDRHRIRVALAPALGLRDEVYGDHVQVWTAFARACAAVGDREGLDRILDVINGETDNTFREQALLSVVAPMAAAAEDEGLDRFEQIARTLDPAFAAPNAVVARLARSLAETGHVVEARARASDLVARLEATADDPEIRVALLRATGEALAEVGRGDAAAAVSRSAVPLTDRFVEMTGASTGVSFEGMGDRTIALADLACTLAASGHLDAWEVAQSSLAAASRNLERRRLGHEVGQRVASAFAEAGDAELTTAAINMAVEAADGYDTHVVAAELAAYVAPTLHRRGRRDVAQELLDDARDVANALADRRSAGGMESEDPDALLGEVAVGLAGAERLQDAMEALGKIEDPYTRAAALQAAAGECEADSEASTALLAQSVGLIGTMSRRVDEVDVLAGAARGYARCGRTDLALETSRNALDAVLEIDEQFRARPLGRIAEAAAGAGADAIAEATLQQARDLLEQSGRSDALQAVARGVTAAHARPSMTLVTSELPLLADRELATDLAGYVIDALVDLGDIDEALRLWHGLLADERLSALEPLSRALVRGVRAVAHLDDGSSLLDLHDRLSAIRAWWDEWGDDPVRPS
jgi:hypothetical protein